MFRLAWNQALAAPAAPEVPFLDQTGDYFINVSYMNSGTMMTLNFGDGGLYADGTSPVTMLWVNGYQKPRYLWYLNELREERNRAGTDRTGPLGLVFLPSDAELAAAPAAPDLPASMLYADIGLGHAAIVLGQKRHAAGGEIRLYLESFSCGRGFVHPDASWRESADRFGQMLVWPAGIRRLLPAEPGAQRRALQWRGAKPGGHLFRLEVSGYRVAPDGRGRFEIRSGRRHGADRALVHPQLPPFPLAGRRRSLIIDDLKTFEPGRFEWLLHVDGTAKQRGLDLEVTKGAAQVLVRPLFPATLPDVGYPADFPEKMRLEEKTGLKDRTRTPKVTYYAFAAPEQSRRTKFIIAVMLLNETNRRACRNWNDWKGRITSACACGRAARPRTCM